ncbi:MAG TPA: helix-turn-helix domain-containing protein [Conexibacter sp.]|jgi:predicted ArsR family transcriptional regulator
MSRSTPQASSADLAGLATLEDPVRRRLYDYVCAQDGTTGRDEAARATSISRSLAAYHLDKLAAHGLLRATYERLEGRTGPGAGRPAKRYARPDREIAVCVPPRDYELAAQLLACAVSDGEPAARAAAREHGRALASGREPAAGERGRAAWSEPVARPDTLLPLLRERGYEPATDPDGTLRLRNCPFHAVAASHPALVCGLNLALLEGALEGLGQPPGRARLDPRPGRCCVAIDDREEERR